VVSEYCKLPSKYWLVGPTALTCDATSGVLYLADYRNHCVRRIDTSGAISIWAGSMSGECGRVDGARAAARFRLPYSVVCDRAGNVLCDDAGNRAIRKVTAPALGNEVSTVVNLTQADKPGAEDDASLSDLEEEEGMSRHPSAGKEFKIMCFDLDATLLYGSVSRHLALFCSIQSIRDL
jgi:hypothetical protein